VTLADLIAEQHDLLIERFLEAARREAESSGLDRVVLLDSMSFLLDDLVEALASRHALPRAASAAASHGVERLAIGFRVDRVVREYALVARMVLDLADEHGVAPSTDELRTLIDAVGEGAAVAAAEFVRRREADLLQRESEHAGFLAHEVRNSLASARFAFDLLRRGGFAETQELVEIVDGGLRQASRRVDDALTGARMRGGVVSPVRVFPRQMLEEIAADLRPQAQARQATLIVEGPHDLTAQADVTLLRSALENLVHNAVRLSRSGGTVFLRAGTDAELLVLEVADECGGIDEPEIDRLFRPFVQAGQERSGYGLGLAIARECAEAQGGTLRVRNVPGHGCVFTLSLPLRS
jgi:signal transduction histidine kinase